MSTSRGPGPSFDLTCTCLARHDWFDKVNSPGPHPGHFPPACQIHPIETRMGEITVSTTVSVTPDRKLVERTTIFRAESGTVREGRNKIGEAPSHHEGVRKWMGGDHVPYEIAWREADAGQQRHDEITFRERVQQTRESEDGVWPGDAQEIA